MNRILLLCIAVTLISSPGLGQQTSPSNIPVVPHFIRFAGLLKDAAGQPLSGSVEATFALYVDQEGGAPLWREDQNVAADRNGRYSLALGITKTDGLPVDLFISGEARWLGVQPAGQPEQPRVLLMSVPYALKAADAETVGGLPPSAFVLATAPGNASTGATDSPGTAVVASLPPPNSAVTGKGTVNFIPLWDTTSDIVNSTLFQSGSGVTARIGINTNAPASTLDVKGSSTIRGPLGLPATATATAAAGKPSQPLNLVASSFNSGTSAAVNQTFQWKAEPAGNNTPSASATLSLLFGSGSSVPAETGLKLSSKGLLTFAAGQKFPGAGTITGITAGTDLTGGGTTGTITLNLNTAATDGRYAQLGAANTFTQALTVNSANQYPVQATSSASSGAGVYGHSTNTGAFASEGVLGTADGPSGVGVFGGAVGTNGIGVEGNGKFNGVFGFSGSNSSAWNAFSRVGVHGDTGVAGGYGVLGTTDGGNAVTGIDSQSGIGVYGASTSGGGVYGTSTSGSGVTGVSLSSDGVVGSISGGTLNTAGVLGRAGAGASFGGIAAVWGDAASHVGVWGTSTSFAGVLGQSTNGYGVQAISNGADGVNAVSHTINGSGVAGINDSSQGGIGVYGHSSSGGYGFYTDSNTGQSRGMGGWVKAMVYVIEDPGTSTYTIARCYNSQVTGAAASTPPCGFSLSHVMAGYTVLDFGFQVSDRFINVLADSGFGGVIASTDLDPGDVTANQVGVNTWASSSDYFSGAIDSNMFIFVF